MSKKARYATGKEILHRIYVDEDMVIEEGDFVCLASAADAADDENLTEDHAVAPEDMVDAGDEAANKAAVAGQLLGIAKQSSPAGTAGYILVGHGAEYELTLETAAAVAIGDQLEVTGDADGCDNQTVEAGSTSPVAICSRSKGATGTAVMALVKPTMWEL